MANRHPNSIDKNRRNKVAGARRFVRELDRHSEIYAVAHFDLAESTKKMIRNQKKTITEMLVHNKICRNLIEENGGTVIKELGDAVLATYTNAPRACQGALNVIHNFQRHGRGIATKVTITAGILEKIMTSKEPDVYGVPVNLCDRMSKYAHADSIVVEEKRFNDIKSWLPKDGRIIFRRPKRVTLEDFGSIQIREIALKPQP